MIRGRAASGGAILAPGTRVEQFAQMLGRERRSET